jgi:hypothetical protein
MPTSERTAGPLDHAPSAHPAACNKAFQDEGMHFATVLKQKPVIAWENKNVYTCVRTQQQSSLTRPPRGAVPACRSCAGPGMIGSGPGLHSTGAAACERSTASWPPAPRAADGPTVLRTLAGRTALH